MSSKEIKPQLYYYLRRGWYTQLIKFCDGIITKKGKDPLAIFWKAFALGMTNNINDCLRLFESFQARRDLQYPVTLALLYFHKRAPSIDHEAIDSLTSELGVAEDVMKEPGMVLAARFALYVENFSLAAKLAEKILGRRDRLSDQYDTGSRQISERSSAFETEAICVEQWIALENFQRDNDTQARRDLQSLDSMLRNKADQADIDLLMVWACSKILISQSSDTLNIFNQIIAMYPLFLPALSDKACLLASAGEWDQALDTAQRVLDNDSEYLDALLIIAVHSFTQECQPNDSVQKLDDFDKALASRESTSYNDHMNAVSLFSTISSRHPRALQICVKMIDRVKPYSPSALKDATLLCQLGHLHLMQGIGQYETALKVFREASKKDPNNLHAMEGMILCQIKEGLHDDAEGQIELISVMHSDEDLSHGFIYLRALLARHNKKIKDHLMYLDDCRNQMSQRSKRTTSIIGGCIIAFQELISMNADFSMLLVMEYLEYMESPPVISLIGGNKNIAVNANANIDPVSGVSVTSMNEESSGENGLAVQRGMDLLNSILHACPGMSCAYIEQSRCYASQGQYEDALRSLHQIIALQPHNSAALVAIAKVELARQNTMAADRALEQALSTDFSIRSVPLFKLYQLIVRAQQNKQDEAIQECELLLNLPEMRALHFSGGTNSGVHTDSLRLTDDDRVTTFITLASLLSKSRRLKEANKILSDAKVLFVGTIQEVQVLVAASQLAVERNDFDTAIRMLDKINEDSPTFTRSQIIKSEILLIHYRDKRKFIQCYEQLVKKDDSAKNYALLGDAYLRILNPEKAEEQLQYAYRKDPTNGRLRARIGRALFATHEYHRAVEFYEAAIRDVGKVSPGPRGDSIVKNTEIISLSHDLAKLYIKLGRAESAHRVLQRILCAEHNNDLLTMRQDVATLLLLAEVQSLKEPTQEMQDTLKKAKDLQKDVVGQVRMGPASVSDVLDQEKVLLSEICEKIASSYLQLKSPDGYIKYADQMYEEALQYNAINVKAMLGLVKLCKNRSEMEQAQSLCRKIISADPGNEEATIILSEIMFNGSDPETAVHPLQDLLKSHPNNYRALEKLIILHRRAGLMKEIPSYLSLAETANKRSATHAGLHYCQGLYARYTNDVGKAISEFNLARRDEDWGCDALQHMIELYLNPNQDGAWEEKDSGPLDEISLSNNAAAEILLKELEPKIKDQQRFIVLQNYWLLATRQKANIDKAMQSFIAMLEKDQDYLPAVLGMATGFMVEKNQHKARNLLKRVAKMEATKQDGEDFGKANLLLAKFFVDKSMYDQAQDLCKKTLAQDKSSSQAWEILGLIMEKEGDHDRAAECYQKAWILEFEASAPVGYKLAFCYLKCKKYVEAIDVCETVLQQYPDYPKIKEEILKKAQLSLRSSNQ